jgi:hypothetical protein
MDETNLLRLIRPWSDNICQITTKKLQYPFCKKILHLNKTLARRGRGGKDCSCSMSSSARLQSAECRLHPLQAHGPRLHAPSARVPIHLNFSSTSPKRQSGTQENKGHMKAEHCTRPVAAGWPWFQLQPLHCIALHWRHLLCLWSAHTSASLPASLGGPTPPSDLKAEHSNLWSWSLAANDQNGRKRSKTDLRYRKTKTVGSEYFYI